MTFASAPLSSAAYFTPSLFAFQKASDDLSASTLKLSSGSRISRASDDVAALSIATRLQSQLSTLKQASSNAAQGDSLLQVAQGGLQQILDILDNMNSLATQSNSSSLTSADRAYLQAEFASYLEEIDRIADNTTFNNIALLNGNLSGESKPTTTTSASTKAAATLLFTSLTGVETVILNGVIVTATNDFAVGGDTAATVENLKTFLNNSTDSRLSKATYTRSGDSLIITADSGGELGENYVINKASSTSTFTVPVGNATQAANIYTLANGDDNGLGVGSTTATGSIGDPLVNTQSQTKGSVTLNLSGAALNGELLRIENGNGGYLDFTFATTASADTDIQIGSTTEETLQNIVETITQYSGTSNYVTRQLDFQINGDSLIIRNKAAGNPADFGGSAPDIAETLTNGSLSAATITGGSNTGVNVNGVNNAEFIGSISGFTATYVGSDSITASLVVGNSTYTAAITDTTPVGANSTIRFTSTSGGYFDVELADGEGQAVTNQTTADTYATRLNAAFEGLTFYQARPVSNFEATGTFVSGSAKLQLSDFSDVRIDSINVTAPVSTDATIDVVINGETFRASSGIGGALGKYETIRFVSLTDSNNALSLTNGSTVQDFSDATAAATFESNLRSAFGLDEEGAGVDFQVGTATTDKVNVVVNSATTDKIFNGSTPNISTQDNAADAQDLIETARASVLTNLANVGSLQTRLQSAQAVNAKITEGVTAANSLLVDTDIAEEATNYATAALRVNSGVAVIAQTRQLQSSLLTILQAGLNG